MGKSFELKQNLNTSLPASERSSERALKTGTVLPSFPGRSQALATGEIKSRHDSAFKEKDAYCHKESTITATQSTASTLATQISQIATSSVAAFTQDRPLVDTSPFEGEDNPFFGAQIQHRNRDISLRVAYEATRVALGTNRKPKDLVKLLTPEDDDNYNKMWNTLVPENCGINIPRCSPVAWAAAIDGFDRVALSGKLEMQELTSISGQSNSRRPSLRFSLSPLRIERALHRMARKYGADRMFVLQVPDFSKESPKLWQAFVIWLIHGKHKFLGRVWRAFFVKQSDSSKERRKTGAPYCYSVNLFAVDGMHIESPISRNKIVRWLLHLRKNKNQKALKLFSRIGLSLSTTHAGIRFEPSQIIHTFDAYSCCPGRRRLADDTKSQKPKHSHHKDANVMNDGCGRISFSAAQRIAKILKLEPIPTAFQGRIGGAKGIWLVDRLNQELRSGEDNGDVWIEITESQLKYHVAAKDEDWDEFHYTFDVHSYSHALKPHALNETLIPILTDRNVRDTVFFELLEMDIDREALEMQQAMEQGGELLLAWVFKNQPIVQERTNAGELAMSGAFLLIEVKS